MPQSKLEKGSALMWTAVVAAVVVVLGLVYMGYLYLSYKRAAEIAQSNSVEVQTIRQAILDYKNQNGRVPGGLAQITSVDTQQDYTYVVLDDGQSFELCTRKPVPAKAKQCFTE